MEKAVIFQIVNIFKKFVITYLLYYGFQYLWN